MLVEQRRKPKFSEIREYQISDIDRDIYLIFDKTSEKFEIYRLKGELINYFLDNLSMLGIEIEELKNAKLFYINDYHVVYKKANAYIFVEVYREEAFSYDFVMDVTIELRIYYY
jgi:hypothetical protein